MGGTGSNVMLLGRPGVGGGVVADRQLGMGADKSDNGIGWDDHRYNGKVYVAYTCNPPAEFCAGNIDGRSLATALCWVFASSRLVPHNCAVPEGRLTPYYLH